MRITEQRIGPTRRPGGRIRPSFDRLEFRLALSGSGAALPQGPPSATPGAGAEVASPTNSTSPITRVNLAPAAVEATSPSSLTVTFNRAVQRIPAGVTDFSLVHVAADGTTTPLMPSEARLTEATDPNDTTKTRVVVSLAQPLADGRYRLILLGKNQLLSPDGSPLTAGGKDLEVTTFTVGVTGVRRADAVDLGTVTSTESFKQDTLALSTDPGVIRLYKLTVPAGHHWRLGLAVDSEMLGTNLSLFDAGGRLIATSNAGRPNSPSDPYLFAGVAPGTYYVGVSGGGNVPGSPGGYDLARGIKGTSGQALSGGAFRLDLVADPADSPTQVLGLGLDHGDPSSKVPTGLSVQFAGPIDEASLVGLRSTPLTVVDASGQTWPVTIVGYDESAARLSLVYNQALPVGQYTLQDGGGLLDLAGMVPQSPDLPAGVLGSFAVGPSGLAPGDLGPLFPVVASQGLGATATVAAGGSAVEQVELIVNGFYTIQSSGASTGLTLSVLDDQGDLIVSGPGGDGSAPFNVFLSPGTYALSLANSGATDAPGSILISAKHSGSASLVVGGVAQGPALELRLIAPTLSIDEGVATSGAPTSPLTAWISASTQSDSSASGALPQIPMSFGSPDGHGGLTGSAAPLGAAPGMSPSALTAHGTSSGSVFLVGAVPIGGSSAAANPISVVGPSGQSSSVALTSNQNGLPAGLVAITARSRKSIRSELELVPGEDAAIDPSAGAVRAGPEVVLGSIALDQGPGADDRILAESDWIERIAAMTLDRFSFLAPAVAPSAPEENPAEGSASAPDIAATGEETRPGEASRVETASIAPSFGLGMIAMIAYRYRHKHIAGARRTGESAVGPNRRPLLKGPHQRARVLR